jgi:RNA polymerase-binding transcription factor DksA
MAETTSNSNLDTALIDAIELDLNAVEAAMDRLEKGTYFTDEITGAPLETNFLVSNPLARRNP